MIVICKTCNEKRTRIHVVVNSKSYFRNAHGKVWRSSKVCPECHKRATAAYMAVTRSRMKQKNLEEENHEPVAELVFKGPERKCNLCSRVLPPNRRFNHLECVNAQDYLDWADIASITL